ncbi:hypothetical protein SNE40_018187 [Patella caerulea]|uniref:Uncharacterized protein n=1 Tax=Patella caerulea TaxID=87958 RepID=A0AAN8JC29_PATCE
MNGTSPIAMSSRQTTPTSAILTKAISGKKLCLSSPPSTRSTIRKPSKPVTRSSKLHSKLYVTKPKTPTSHSKIEELQKVISNLRQSLETTKNELNTSVALNEDLRVQNSKITEENNVFCKQINELATENECLKIKLNRPVSPSQLNYSKHPSHPSVDHQPDRTIETQQSTTQSSGQEQKYLYQNNKRRKD